MKGIRTNPKSVTIWIIQGVVIIVLVIVSVLLRRFLRPVHRGFHCNDVTIRYPHRSSSVPYWLMAAVAGPLTIFVFFAGELYHRRRKSVYNVEHYQIAGKKIDSFLVRLVQFFLIFFLGYAMTTCLTSMVKNSTGRLRPHFLEVCQPNVDYRNCNSTAYFYDYECLHSDDTEQLINSRLSFFSGHTSAAFYIATFFIIYMHARVARFEISWMPMFTVFYTALFAVATLVGVTRIVDNKHHSSDVIVGGIVGMAMAVAMLYCHKHLFSINDDLRSSRTKPSTSDIDGSIMSTAKTNLDV
ncbi:PAP2 superfamily domain-containing protein [Ditylenchus destructor]|uniref:PAP2 superfamily domain-containing protein n=1 Tax=Ditylenchus destructor TaxID=166010 RepID=A0AAD4N1I4_9BILA|nr:PAP2 superfamily domain-containing protein [Ditylenchus destructor]